MQTKVLIANCLSAMCASQDGTVSEGDSCQGVTYTCSGEDFLQCGADDKFVFKSCADGTVCRSIKDSIVCDFTLSPKGQIPEPVTAIKRASVTEPVTELATEPVTEVATEPVTEVVIKQATEPPLPQAPAVTTGETSDPNEDNVVIASGKGCGDTKITVTKAQMLVIAETDCGDLFCKQSYVDALNVALEEYQVCNVLDVAAFLAQARHETGHFKIGRQDYDNGVGSIHMIPSNFQNAVDGMRAVNPDLTDPLKGVSSDVIEQGDALLKEDYFWRMGLWWLQSGSDILGCKDKDLLHSVSSSYTVDNPYGNEVSLREQGTADALDCEYAVKLFGDAVPTFYKSHDDTGFYKMTRCIFGNCFDGGMENRKKYLDLAIQTLDASSSLKDAETNAVAVGYKDVPAMLPKNFA